MIMSAQSFKHSHTHQPSRKCLCDVDRWTGRRQSVPKVRKGHRKNEHREHVGARDFRPRLQLTRGEARRRSMLVLV